VVEIAAEITTKNKTENKIENKVDTKKILNSALKRPQRSAEARKLPQRLKN